VCDGNSPRSGKVSATGERQPFRLEYVQLQFAPGRDATWIFAFCFRLSEFGCMTECIATLKAERRRSIALRDAMKKADQDLKRS